MLNFQLDSQEVFLAMSLLLLSLTLIILGLRWYIRRFRGHSDQNSPTWLHHKNLPFDPLQHNRPVFQVGLITALTLTLLAFNWSQRDPMMQFEPTFLGMEADLEIAPPPNIAPPTPPPPPPPSNIEEVPEEELPEELDPFEDQGIDIEDEIILPAEPAPKALPKALPPPPVENENIEEIFVNVERMPAFPGCEAMDGDARKKCTEQQFFRYIFGHLKYPAIARENNIQGNVVVSFVINKKGKIEQIELVRDIGGGCGDAAISTIKKMQEEILFEPGRQQTKAVSVRYNVPIRFKLQ